MNISKSLGFSITVLILAGGIFASVQFKPSYGFEKPPSPITTEGCGSHSIRGLSVDWDYELIIGELVSDNIMIKNKHAKQETVSVDSGCNMTVSMNCCDDYEPVLDSMSAFMSTGKIKVSDHSIKFDKVIKMKYRFQDRMEIGLKVPKLKAGTYYFIVKVSNNDELQTFFITKMKVFKPTDNIQSIIN